MGLTISEIRDTPRAHDINGEFAYDPQQPRYWKGHIEHMPPGTLFKIDDGLPTTIWMKLGKFLVPKIDIPQVECAVNLSSGQVMAFRAHCHFLIIDAELVVHGEHRNLVVR